MLKLTAKELRTTFPEPDQKKNLKKNPVYIILDNVLDTYNVGAIFRLADAVSAERVILCGDTEQPPHTRIKKASINTTEWVSWEYFATTEEAIEKLREEINAIQIVAIEQHKDSTLYTEASYTFPVAFIVGHETTGVSDRVLKLADTIVEIPMWGVNKSLNVMVSLGIVLFEVMRRKA